MEQLDSICMLIPVVITLHISCMLMAPKSKENWEIQWSFFSDIQDSLLEKQAIPQK